jgi:hypothetical protein
VALERPPGAGSTMTESEAVTYWERNAARAGVGMEAPFFGPESVSALVIAGGYRTSLVVTPEDGRIATCPSSHPSNGARLHTNSRASKKTPAYTNHLSVRALLAGSSASADAYKLM